MKILVSGYYGFNNGGDEAIAYIIAKEFSKNNNKVVFLSSNPYETEQNYNCNAIKRTNIFKIIKTMKESDIFLSGGGGLLQDCTSKKNLIYYLGLIILANIFCKKALIFNQSIGPLTKFGERSLILIKNNTFIVRDKQSFYYLKRLGLKKVILGADPAILFNSNENINNLEKINIKQKKILIAPRGDIKKSFNSLKKLIKELKKTYKVTILSMMQNDLDMCFNLDGDELISFENPEKLSNLIAEHDFVIGVRLHAIILAAANYIPSLGINYDPKIKGFCKDLNVPCLEINFDYQEALDCVNKSFIDVDKINNMKLLAENSFNLIKNLKMELEK